MADEKKDAPNSELYKRKCNRVAYDLWLHGNKALAARKAKISVDTIDNWLKYPGFSVLIEEKGAELEEQLFNDLLDEKQWTAKAWILERRCGNKYQPPKQRIDQTIRNKAEDLTDDELAAIITSEQKDSGGGTAD